LIATGSNEALFGVVVVDVGSEVGCFVKIDGINDRIPIPSPPLTVLSSSMLNSRFSVFALVIVVVLSQVIVARWYLPDHETVSGDLRRQGKRLHLRGEWFHPAGQDEACSRDRELARVGCVRTREDARRAALFRSLLIARARHERRPRSDLYLNLAVVVDVLDYLGKVAHVEPLFADRTFHEMIELGFGDAVGVDAGI
jgi:hypothetical protein